MPAQVQAPAALTAPFAPGGYRYLAGLAQHSAGVAADRGFEIHRARFREPLPIAQGFAAAESHLRALGRPTTALAACELRSPRRFSEQEFAEFNRGYVQLLERLGFCRNGENPVARTNVCPEHAQPQEPCLYAFSYTVPGNGRSFVLAGAVEAPDGKGVYDRGQIVRAGETTPEAMRDKMRYVIARMAERLQALGFGWRDALVTQVYTVQDIGSLVGEELAQKGLAAHGIRWHFCRPPVVGLEFEMDVQGAAQELVL